MTDDVRARGWVARIVRFIRGPNRIAQQVQKTHQAANEVGNESHALVLELDEAQRRAKLEGHKDVLGALLHDMRTRQQHETIRRGE